MKRADLWKIYTDKNPRMAGLDDDHITMTVRGLRKLFETTWEQGHDAGFENGRAWERAHPVDSPKGGSDVFKDLFGKDNPFKT